MDEMDAVAIRAPLEAPDVVDYVGDRIADGEDALNGLI